MKWKICAADWAIFIAPSDSTMIAVPGMLVARGKVEEVGIMNPSRIRPGRRNQPIQYLTFGPWEFNINKAMLLAGNTQKYQPETPRSSPDWAGPTIYIVTTHIGRANPSQPFIFSTIIHDLYPCPLLLS